MKSRLFQGLTILLTLFTVSAFGQTKIHDNLIIPPHSEKWEVEIHGAGWSVTPITKIFDSQLDEIYSDEIIYSLTYALRNSPISIDPSEIDYTKDFDYTSVGYYYGLAVRYYPSGGASKFVFGLSVDKTNVKVKGHTDFTQNVIPSLKADGTGMIHMQPILANLHLQYYFSTDKKFKPYLAFGLGAGFLNKQDKKTNSFQFDLNTSFKFFGIDYSVPANFSYSFEEIEERSGKSIPGVMPLVNLAFGAKTDITERLSVNFEAGIYNGLSLKLGLAHKF